MKIRYALKSIFLVSFVILGAYLFIHYELNLFLLDQNKAIKLIISFHPYDDLVFIAFQIFQVLLAGTIPAEISGFIGGYLYGPVLGTIYSTLGLSIGSWFAFILARVYGLPLVRMVVKASIMEKYDHFMEQRGPLVSFILFLIPGFPNAALCYIIGLSQMKIWTFMVISAVGRLFGTILLSVTGSFARDNHSVGLLVLLGIVGVIFLLLYFHRDRFMRMTGRQKSMDLRKK